ncbi:MAG TPA: SPOR domain-containing protein [Acidobacteriota bacterium]|nr:SPOR domain-containing protein [Acidobacteriota bacterium]
MTDNSSDSGYELVLDNRRLIVFFVLLVLICCCFFVVGFVEGKRQGFQAGSQTAAETAAKSVSEAKEPEHASAVADSEKAPVKEDAEKQQLNWYKNVSGQEQKNTIAHVPAEPASAPKGAPKKEKETAKPVVVPLPAEPAPAPKASAKKETVNPAAVSAPAASVSYTVQVGAFRQRQQVEAKAKALKAKGFDCRIEVPQSSEDLYLLKVGRFKSKAEAVEMELRLKKNGFSSFIKTN